MSEDLTPGAFWGAQGMRAIGVAIVTAKGSEGPAGFLALSATHLTASPPIMSVAVMPSTSALAAIRESGAFAINYLAESAGPIYERFTSKDAPKGAARFEGLDCSTLETGAPILPDVVGAMDCTLEREDEVFGTHLLFGKIVALHQTKGLKPLVFFGGKTPGL